MKNPLSLALALILSPGCWAQDSIRSLVHLEDDWRFINEEVAGAELPGTDTTDWETVTNVRIWVKKMSIAIHCTPFIVADTDKRA